MKKVENHRATILQVLVAATMLLGLGVGVVGLFTKGASQPPKQKRVSNPARH